MAHTPRKSSFSAPRTVSDRHVPPPSVVNIQVPAVPLDQATRALTTLMPRRETVVPLVCPTHDCAHAAPANRITASFMPSNCSHAEFGHATWVVAQIGRAHG